jgi:hypothetical protein
MDNNLAGKIVFSSKLEENDFIKASKVIKKIKVKERKWLVYLITIPAVIIGFAIGLYKAANENNINTIPSNTVISPAPWYIAYLPSIFLLLFLVVFFVLLAVAKNAPKRHYQSNKPIQQEMQFSIDSEAIGCSSPNTSSIIRWDELYKVYLSKDYFVFFISNLTVWIIPKKNIAKEITDEIINIIKANINKKKIVISKY